MNCPNKKCKGRIMMVDAFNENSAVDYDYECSDACGWICADAERSKLYRSQQQKQTAKKKHPKRVEFKPDSPELVAAIRAEVQRRMEILATERAKFPPTLIRKGKRWVSNPKFTEKMRKHMHGFAVSAEQIREELINA